MKTLVASLVVAAALVFGQSARAQITVTRGAWYSPAVTSTPMGGATFVTPAYGATYYYARGYIPPYSYWAAYPYPARTYVGYGTNDFPFYGRPYGHPYDAWSWTYMGDPYRGLAKYYYPPVR